MNRTRNASGINSYEQDFNFKPQQYLQAIIEENGHASWLDLCCGHGNALQQTADFFYKTGQQQMVYLKGIDLIDTFPATPSNITCLNFLAASLAGWQENMRYDLITCVHGLHYIGDKLKLLETAVTALEKSGLFIGNIDLNNLMIDGKNNNDYFKKIIKENDFLHNSRKNLLQRTGNSPIRFNLKYIGADDISGPNYTGQDSVTSYYSSL